MRTEYKRDMNHNYLILHGEGEVDTGSYQVRMLVGNVMPSILKCRVQELDGAFGIYYDITSRQALTSVYEEKKLRMEDLKLIFGGFIQVMEEMDEYLLNPAQLLIAPEYMYVDVEKRQIYFCCFPGKEGDVHKEFLNLTEYVLPKIDHCDRRAVMLGYGIYRKSLEDSFQLEHIKEELYKNREEDVAGNLLSEAHTYRNRENPWEREAEGEKERDRAAVFGENTGKEALVDRDNSYEALLREEDNFRREEEKTKGRRKKERKSKAGNQKEIQKQKEVRNQTGTLWKSILACGIYGGIFLGIAAAKVYGILPGISVEMILGGAIAGIGAGMLGYLVWKKFRGAYRAEEHTEEKGNRRSMAGNSSERIFSPRENEIYENTDAKEISMRERTDVPRVHESEKSYGETVVLSAGAVQGPATLVSREPGELATIYLQEEITVIGKMETAADAVINLPTVSRMHAKIRRRDGEYYLSDLNSRNGTAVNGRLLQSGEDYCLQEQDEVDFAQARYVFLK